MGLSPVLAVAVSLDGNHGHDDESMGESAAASVSLRRPTAASAFGPSAMSGSCGAMTTFEKFTRLSAAEPGIQARTGDRDQARPRHRHFARRELADHAITIPHATEGAEVLRALIARARQA